MKYKSQSGFTLLEVIMALVILSTALIPLFTLFSTHLDAMRRMADENEKAAAITSILSFMDTVNPAEAEQGNADGSGYVYSWTTKPLLELEKPLQGSFQIGLYETTVNVMKKEDQPWFDFKIRQTGYVREASGGDRPAPILPGEKETPSPQEELGDEGA